MSSQDEKKTNQVGISYNGTTITTMYTGDEWLELIDDFVEDTRFPSRAAAIRSLVILGMREYALGDPRRSDHEYVEDEDDESSPTTIRELIPEGKENSLSLKEDGLIDKINNQLLDIVDEDPEINRDGWEVYR